MSGSAEESPKSQRSSSSSSTASLPSLMFQGGQDLSHWDEPEGILGDSISSQNLSQDMFATAPERLLGDKLDSISSANFSQDMFTTASESFICEELDRIPSPEFDIDAETASQFFDRKTAHIPSSSKQSEDDCFSQYDCQGQNKLSFSQDIPPQEQYENLVPNTQSEIEARISESNSFADRFHTECAYKLKSYMKPDSETTKFHYIVLASQVLEKYIGLSFPDDPKGRKTLRNKIDKTRELNFGKYYTSDEDTLEPQAGPSGCKRPKKEKKLSPQKKVRKNDSDSSD